MAEILWNFKRCSYSMLFSFNFSGKIFKATNLLAIWIYWLENVQHFVCASRVYESVRLAISNWIDETEPLIDGTWFGMNKGKRVWNNNVKSLRIVLSLGFAFATIFTEAKLIDFMVWFHTLHSYRSDGFGAHKAYYRINFANKNKTQWTINIRHGTT